MQSLNKKLPLLVLLLIITLWMFGCTNQDSGDANDGLGSGNQKQKAKNQTEGANGELQNLLPDKEGFHWVYNGFAEYGHTMDLKKIEKKDSEIQYTIEGEVADLSDGESPRDFFLDVEYVIKDGVLTQKKKEELMLDSISDEIQLVKTPLEQGSRWIQTTVDRDGNELKLDSQITEITEENGIKEYTVIYEDQNSDYFERRKIREGTGVVSFEKMLKNEGESFVAGYTLNEESSGYR